MRAFSIRLGLFLLTSFAVVSCTSTTEGVPGASQPPGGSSSSASTAAPQYSVEEPLDISQFLPRPCDLLPVESLNSNGIDPMSGRAFLPEDDVVAAESGPYCSWPDEDLNLSAGIQSGNTERSIGGLSGLRLSYEQGRYELWEETSNSGYPAVYFGVADRRSEGSCQIAVGVSEDMTFTVSADVYSENPEEACRVVDEVAADVIQNLRGKN